MALEGWYPFIKDCKDYSGYNNHINTDTLPLKGGKLGGYISYKQNEVFYVPLTEELKRVFGGEEFTICYWMNQEQGKADWADYFRFQDTNNVTRRMERGNVDQNDPNDTKADLWSNLGNGDGQTNSNFYKPNINVAHGNWFHVALRRTKERCELFINGKLEQAVNNRNTYCEDINTSFAVLADLKCSCEFSDLRLYSHAISKREIKDISLGKILHWKANNPRNKNMWVGGVLGSSTMRDHTVLDPDNWKEKFPPPPPEARGDKVAKFTSGCLTSVWSGNSHGYILKDITAMNDARFILSAWVFISEDCDITNCPVKIESGSHYAPCPNHSMNYDMKRKGTWQRLACTGSNIDANHVRFLVYPRKHGVEDGSFSGFFCITAPQVEYCGGAVTPDAPCDPTPFTPSDFDLSKHRIRDLSGFGNDGKFYNYPEKPLNVPYYSTDSIVGHNSFGFINKTNYEKCTSIVAEHDQYIPEKGTIAFWFKANRENQTNGRNQYLVGYYDFCAMGCSLNETKTCRNGMIYKIPSGTNKTVEASIPDIYNNQWHHYVVTWNNIEKMFNLYIDGKHIYGKPFHSDGARDIKTFRKFAIGSAYNDSYGGVTGRISDVRVYATELMLPDVEHIYGCKASVDNTGKLTVSGIKSPSYKPSLVDYSGWTIGQNQCVTGADQLPYTSRFYRNGSPEESIIRVGCNPIGQNDIVWATDGNDTTKDADGGFATGRFKINKNQDYRFSIWIRRTKKGLGSYYFGLYGRKTADDQRGLEDMTSQHNIVENPYFYSSTEPLDNEWMLLVGYVRRAKSTTTKYTDSGIYKQDGTCIKKGLSFYRWTEDATLATLRAYLFYSTNATVSQEFYRPRVDVMDGTQPSIDELLNCREHGPLLEIDSNNNVLSGHSTLGKTKFTKDSIGRFTNITEVGNTDGLVGFWKFKDLSNSALVHPEFKIQTSDGVKLTGESLILKPNQRIYYLDTGKNLQMMKGDASQPFTLFTTFRPLEVDKQEMMVFGKSGNHGGILIHNGKICSRNRTKAGPIKYIWDKKAAVPGQLYSVAITYDGKTSKLFINGEYMGKDDTMVDYPYGNAHFMSGFARDNLYYFNGTIFETKLFSRALTDKEAQAETKRHLAKAQIDKNANISLNQLRIN